MRGFDELDDIIARHIERALSGRHSERHGLVTSYDPENHLAKVMYQPEGFESDWLPIETDHIGNGYGIAIGLTPGDGKETGDQVIIRMQEGDMESGKIVKRVHSDKDKPPTVQSGEMCFWTTQKDAQGNVQSQMRLFFRNDGSMNHEILDKDGQVMTSTKWNEASITHNTTTNTVNTETHTENASSLISMQSGSGGGDIETVGKNWLGLDNAGERPPNKKMTLAGPAKKVFSKVG